MSVKARSSLPILATSPAASRRASGTSGAARPARTRWTVAGRARTTSRRRSAPGDPGGISCTSSSSKHTSSGARRIRASMTSRAPGAVRRPGPRVPLPAETAPRRARAKQAGSSYAASQPTHTSIPRGATWCARTAWARTVVLPKPGPATSSVTARSQRPSSSRTSRRRGSSTSRTRGRAAGRGISAAADDASPGVPRPEARGLVTGSVVFITLMTYGAGSGRADTHRLRNLRVVRALTMLRRAGQTRPVTEWIYFIHPPRDDFAATMTAEEETVWAEHFQRLKGLLASGQLILAGPTLGTANTGLVIFDAPDGQAARKVMEEDPVVRGGYARGRSGRSGYRCCAGETDRRGRPSPGPLGASGRLVEPLAVQLLVGS